MYSVLGIVFFIFVIMTSVVLHEAGHMLAAKKVGLKVPRFFAGFGKTLWSFNYKGTEYGLKLIPLGGFVEIHDTSREDETERALLNYVTPWKRIVVFIAGPVVNLILGTIICIVAFMSFTMPIPTNVVDTVNSCTANSICGAEKAGIKPGDKIIKIDNIPIDDKGSNIKSSIAGKTKVEVVVLRDNKEMVFTAPIATNMIGVTMSAPDRHLSLMESIHGTKRILTMNLQAIIALPSKIPYIFEKVLGENNKDTQQAPSSIVGVGQTYAHISAMDDTQSKQMSGTDKPTWQVKLYILVMYSALLNFGLGLFNLLPLLPLDGGRIAVAIVDALKARFAKIRKKEYIPLSVNVNYWLTVATGSFVVAFAALVLVADIVHLIIY